MVYHKAHWRRESYKLKLSLDVEVGSALFAASSIENNALL
jgi:hypothetical protein